MAAQPPLPTRSFLGAFGLLEEEGKMLLVANRRCIRGRDVVTWDLPGGGVDPDETLAEALVREMREETSLRVEVGPLRFVSEGERVRAGHRVSLWRSFFFEIRRLQGDVDVSEDPDILEAGWVSEDEALQRFTAPYHGGFRRFLDSRRTIAHAFDRWEDDPHG